MGRVKDAASAYAQAAAVKCRPRLSDERDEMGMSLEASVMR
jgi:hypothetical protein